MNLYENSETLIGVDLGGTNVHVARISGENIDDEHKVNINASGPAKEVLAELIQAIKMVWTEKTQGIGLGIPSVCDIEKGIVYDVQNIPSWTEIHLKDILEQEFKVPVNLNNDANCFAVGEKYFGHGKKYEDFIGLIIGTGMAGGIIVNNRLYNGPNCGSGEFGMMPYKKQFYEYYCSGRYFTRKYDMTGEQLFDMAESGSIKALKVFKRFGRHMGSAIKAILYAYDPQAIILGGSVSKSYKFFKEEIDRSLEDFAYQKSLENFKIEVSEDPNIPVLGAAALYLDNLNNDKI